MKTMTKKERKTLVGKLEKQLAKLCDRIYGLSVEGRRLTPLYPYLLTRVLPKEHITPGGLVLPETDQNKILYEGIVIATWQPYDEIRKKKLGDGSEITTVINH